MDFVKEGTKQIIMRANCELIGSTIIIKVDDTQVELNAE